MSLSLLLTGALGVAAVVAVLVTIDLRRTKVWRSLAASHGWQYLDREPGLGRFGRFRACRAGEQHQLQRWARGPIEGVRVDLAQIAHVERDRVQRRLPRATAQTACLVEDPELSVPAFFARPRDPLLDQLGRLADVPDLAFPEDPAFAAAFLVQADDAAAARARLDAPSRAWMTKHAAGHWTYEGVGTALLIAVPKALSAPELQELVAAALELARLWRTDVPAAPQEERTP